MKNAKFIFAAVGLLILTACNVSTENRPAPPKPPVSAKEAVITIEKALLGLAPGCVVKVVENAKGIELKEYKASFGCDTSESKLTTADLKTLDTKLNDLLSTIVIARRSDLDSNQKNYVDAIESEANLMIISIKNSISSATLNDLQMTALILKFLKKWDCQYQDQKIEKWPLHILTSSEVTCKIINLADYKSVYESNKAFLADLEVFNLSYLRPDSKPAMYVRQMRADYPAIFESTKAKYIKSIDQCFPDYVSGSFYPKSVVIDSVPLYQAKENPQMLEKIRLVQEFFKDDLKNTSQNSEFYKLINKKIEEIQFVSNQVAPYELGFTVSYSSCSIEKNVNSIGYSCSGSFSDTFGVSAKESYPNKPYGTLRVSLKTENLPTANLQTAIVETGRIIKENANDKLSKLSNTASDLKYNIDDMPNSKVFFKTLNSELGGSIDSLQILLDQVLVNLKDKQFTNKNSKTINAIKYMVLINLDSETPDLAFPIISPLSGDFTITIVLNITDTPETIAVKLNPYLVPIVKK